MLGIAVAAKRLVTIITVMFVAVFLFAPMTFAQSTIKAQLCNQSVVTIVQPAHDGTVNNPVVHFTGTVGNANQIEVYVDNNYSTQIPLSSGATTYASDVTIGTGTHAIKLSAVGNCSGVTNGEASLVVTYEPAKAAGPTSTNVSENGSKVGSTDSTPQSQSPLSPSLDNNLSSIGQWLNIKIDNQQASQSQLSFVRGGVLVAGLVLSVFGVAAIIVDWFARATSGFLLPALAGAGRILAFRIFFRVVGVATVLLALFL
ncbi:MAG: hypothetical protein JWO07_517 [Candidatus Saccharibacteria bacterium]|nr:hypothetical protein [Candidatus Saccharibacteria bacterium]